MRLRAGAFAGRFVIGFVTCASVLCVRAALTQTKPVEPQKQEFLWDSHAWQELTWKDSLGKAEIEEADRRAVVAAIEEELRPKMNVLEISSEGKLREAALKTRVKMIDLNGDGEPEVVAQAITDCSPTGNCSLWVFQKSQRGYRLILKGFGQTFAVQPSMTDGYHDIVVSMHDSATQAGLSDFRFAGRRYAKNGCYYAEWEVLEGDKVRELKVPRITLFPCSSY
jgi:hypothetical protein